MSTYDFYNAVVYYITQNQDLGRSIKMIMLLSVFLLSLYADLTSGLGLKWTETGGESEAKEKVEVDVGGFSPFLHFHSWKRELLKVVLGL